MRSLRVRILVESAVMIALATVLSLVKVYSMPQGGSVTAASMLPIMLIGFRWGPRAGITAGIVYGIVQYFEEPFMVHPVQVLLDYPVAFGLLGLAGFFRGREPARIVAGLTAGALGRYLAHVVSGVVFFAEYAPEGVPPLTYSLVYNLFIFPELVLMVLIGLIVVPRLQVDAAGQAGSA
ncbi:MAG: energy-coupled thiamine transporter ThiT [Bacillota bacterium]|nr:MAG: energy-coupled thiamine transporter ThiT [Bacillota bacterium]